MAAASRSPPTPSTTYTYDLVGRRTAMTEARGITTTATYDDAGQMTAAGSPNETRSYSYDGAGRRTGMTDNTGTTTFDFDDALIEGDDRTVRILDQGDGTYAVVIDSLTTGSNVTSFYATEAEVEQNINDGRWIDHSQ